MKKNVKIGVSIYTNGPKESHNKNMSPYMIVIQSSENQINDSYLIEYALGFIERYSFISDIQVTDILSQNELDDSFLTKMKKCKKSIIIQFVPKEDCIFFDTCDFGTIYDDTKIFKEEELTISEFCDYIIESWRKSYADMKKAKYEHVSYKTIVDFKVNRVEISGKSGYLIENVANPERSLVLSGIHELKNQYKDFHIYPITYNKNEMDVPYSILNEGKNTGKIFGWFITMESPSKIFKSSKKEKRLTSKNYKVTNRNISFGPVFSMFQVNLMNKNEVVKENV